MKVIERGPVIRSAPNGGPTCVLDVAAGEFLQSDAASLRFRHGGFHAAVSRRGIIFEADAEAAAGRIRATQGRAHVRSARLR